MANIKKNVGRELVLKAGCELEPDKKLYEGYFIDENYITANVGVDKIGEVMKHFIDMHEREMLYFFMEIPSGTSNGDADEPGAEVRNVYYMDDCTKEDAVSLLDDVGDLLYNDGLSSFGFGGLRSRDEIDFGKYNICQIVSDDIDLFLDFFDQHRIKKNEELVTGLDIVSKEHPAMCRLYTAGGRSVLDIPGLYKDKGMYLADKREY